MPTLFARRYVRKIEAVGHAEKLLGAVILLLMAAVIAGYVVQVATNREYLFNVGEAGLGPAGAASAPNLLSDSRLTYWRGPDNPEHFAPDELYVKIDGRADAFRAFHVAGLTCGTYVRTDDPARMIDVYWYDMGTPENAAGMYESERAPGVTMVEIGRAGYQVGGAVFFWKGGSYVQVLPSQPDEADGQAVLQIASAIAQQVRE